MPSPQSDRSPRPLPSTIRVGAPGAGGRYVVRTLDLEEYVAGVLAGEAAARSAPAALEALAITIRTFALANLGRHGADGFDMCELTHCQVLGKPTAATRSAAAATAGMILLDRGAPASVFYAASCGGHSERPSAVWPGAADPPFLSARPDEACEGQPVWSAELSGAELLRALRAGGFNGRALRDLRVVSRTESGRVAQLRLDGLEPSGISGQDLRALLGRVLGWQHIKSTAFDVRRNAAGFQFVGHGSGHGVGLCVIGSANLAARGESADAILAHYFPGLEISAARSVPAREPRVTAVAERADVLISLPSGDEGEREVIRSLAAQARDTIAGRLGVQAPSRIVLRFHPTIASYQRTTGQPWFTTAVVRGGEAHFAPLTVLRAQGGLERTIRRQVVRLLTAPTYAGRPLWVSEGAALYFGAEGSPASYAAQGRSRLSCPRDEELREPVSAGALGLAYQRAAGCFAAQMDAGRAWREIR